MSEFDAMTGIQFDEDRGGPRRATNLLSFPSDGDVYLSTKDAWPWDEPPVHDVGSTDQGRDVIPSVWIESLFKKAPVPQPRDLKEEKCYNYNTLPS